MLFVQVDFFGGLTGAAGRRVCLSSKRNHVAFRISDPR